MATRRSASAGFRPAEVGGIEVLDSAPDASAAALLASCCSVQEWVSAMLACRPFGTVEKLLRRAPECWALLEEEELLEALNAHPRIGEDVPAGSWSALEQAAATEGPAPERELAAANREYERRFGFRFVVFAEGKPAALILELMAERLSNDRDEELRLAAEQAGLIAQGRLRKLVAP